MIESYHLEGVRYNREELLSLATQRVEDSNIPLWESKVFAFIINWFSNESFIIVTTSGSTGSPKQIRIEKERMRASAVRTLDFFRIGPGQTALLALPVENIAGMMMVVRAFEGGLDLRMISPQQIDLGNTARTIDFTALVPLQVGRLLESGDKLNKVRKLIVGGAAIPHQLREKLRESFTGEIWETYGMTETITHIAVRDVRTSTWQDPFRALPGVAFSQDNRGCLVITDSVSGVSELVTNDLIGVVSSRSFRLLGRIDNVINTGGIKVNPEEVEAMLQKHIDGDFCVSSLPDQLLGEVIVLVLSKGFMQEALGPGLETLPKYYHPKKVLTIDTIPHNPNGKIDRSRVKEMIMGTSI